MNRRTFLEYSGLLPFISNDLLAESIPTLDAAARQKTSDRVLVLIELKGGNDGLNTVLPINQYDLYRQFRPFLGLPDTGASAFITLDQKRQSSQQIGLHPALAGFKRLYETGKMNIVQGVGYPSPNLSHFKSTDLWLTGGDGTPAFANLKTGWMGRFLQNNYAEQLLKNDPAADPLSIQLGDTTPSLGFKTNPAADVSSLLGLDSRTNYYSMLAQEFGSEPLARFPANDYGRGLRYVSQVERATLRYADRISDVLKKGKNLRSYPNFDLANQLKTVARLLNGGSKTKLFLCSLGGFDTHNSQLHRSAPHLGEHAELLKTLSESITAFMADLDALGLGDNVATVTFSEFGRCVIENTSSGTDHGTIAPLFVFGNKIKPGITGQNANLSLVNAQNGFQLQNRQYDYRQVLATLMHDWLKAPKKVVEETLLENYLQNRVSIF